MATVVVVAVVVASAAAAAEASAGSIGVVGVVGVAAVSAIVGGADVFLPFSPDGSGRLVDTERLKLGLRMTEEVEVEMAEAEAAPPFSSAGVRI